MNTENKLVRNRVLDYIRKYGLFFVPILVILPGINDFAFPAFGGNFSDAVLTHFPNAIYLQDSLREGIVPLWSPSIFGGYPFVAHPYSGIWYPLYWPFLLFAQPLGLNLFIATHLFLAGVGSYLLLETMGLSRRAAILGGLAFALSPKLFAHYGAGHLMLLAAVCLTPWLFWLSLRRRGVGMRERFLQAGLMLALIFFADPRWAFYAAGAWAVWMIAHSHIQGVRIGIRRVLKQGFFALLLMFPALWLFTEFSLLSTRAALTVKETLTLSLPSAALWNAFLPVWGAFHEWLVYWGIVPIVFIGAAIVRIIVTDRHRLFWPLLLLSGIYLSLGSNVIGGESLAQWPGFAQLRVPPRALFLSAFAATILVAFGWDAMQSLFAEGKTRIVELASFGLAIFLLGVTVSFSLNGQERWIATLFVAGIMIIFWLGVKLTRIKKLSPKYFYIMSLALLIIDLGVMDRSLIDFRSKDSVLNEDRELAAFLASKEGEFRSYSPSYSLARQSAAIAELQMLNGIDPLQLKGFTEYFTVASGILEDGYSVSQPNFSSTDIEREHESAIPNAELLGLMNVRFVLTEFPIENINFVPLSHIGQTIVYENQADRGRAWFVSPDGSEEKIELISASANQIMLEIEGPGLLVLAEIDYPGWLVWVNGVESEIRLYQNLLRSVQIEDGATHVEFRFQPQALRIGLPISILTLFALFVWPKPKTRAANDS